MYHEATVCEIQCLVFCNFFLEPSVEFDTTVWDGYKIQKVGGGRGRWEGGSIRDIYILTCWLLWPHPWDLWQLLRIEVDMCSYMYTHNLPSYPPFHLTKHYIAYCFPNVNHVTFSTQPVVYVSNNMASLVWPQTCLTSLSITCT